MAEKNEDQDYLLIESYSYLIDDMVGDIEVTEDILIRALKKCIGDKKRRKDLDITEETTNSDILNLYVTEDDIYNAINSAANLRKRTIDTSVKFDEVRSMDLSFDNWKSYHDGEKQFALERLQEYQDFYSLEAPNDKFGIYDVIDIEVRMQTIRLFLRMARPKDPSIEENEMKLTRLRQQWSKALDDLNLKKKQRDVAKNTPKETADTYINAIKELDEMEAEERIRQKEILKKKAEKRNQK